MERMLWKWIETRGNSNRRREERGGIRIEGDHNEINLKKPLGKESSTRRKW